jgi:hypothetical protein
MDDHHHLINITNCLKKLFFIFKKSKAIHSAIKKIGFFSIMPNKIWFISIMSNKI